MALCQLCRRPGPLTRHHLVPRTLHKRLRRRGDPRDLDRTIELCPACHRTVHAFLSEKQLAERYDTLERLLTEERIRAWCHWIADKPAGYLPRTRTSNERKLTRGRGRRR